jgi:hypothetical protein
MLFTAAALTIFSGADLPLSFSSTED